MFADLHERELDHNEQWLRDIHHNLQRLNKAAAEMTTVGAIVVVLLALILWRVW